VNVAVVAHFYPPEPCAAATRIASLAAALTRAGHDVTVVTTFPSFPTDCFLAGSRPVPLRSERCGEVRVVRLWSLLVRGLPGRRLLHWGSAAFAAAGYLLLTRRRYDQIIVSLPPITLAPVGIIAAWRHRAKLVADVRDVFPDIAIAMGAWRPNGFWARAVERLARALYRRADLIVAVTPTALEQIAARGVDPARLLLVRNAAEHMAAVPRAAPCGGFTAIYAGNLGVATDVDLLLEAARLLTREGITITVVGDGARGRELAERARGVANLVLRGSLPRAAAMRAVAAADVAIVPLRKGIAESVPTKLYDAVAVGCPVVVAGDGEARTEGAALGALCVAAGDAAALAAALRRLAALDRQALRALGDQGRARLAARADRAAVMGEFAARVTALG
jgi:colanic acid biosynthesis glycosyl transferase WcaI